MKYNSDLQRFEITTSYQEYKAGLVGKIKDARFRFEKEPRPVWWTDNAERASLLISCADDSCRAMLESKAKERDNSLSMSRAHDADLGSALIKLGLEPYDFQKAGIAYASSRKQVFFCDEPGLGKTLQALASVHLNQAYPCIAVVPATIKINWRKEATRCIPELATDGAVQILSGETVTDLKPGALFYIINYDILGAWLPVLQKLGAKTIILDESHFAKNMEAQRTRACLELATGIRIVKEKGKKTQREQISDGIPYRYLLSGTPEPNRPAELESQLEILGVLQLFGGSWGYKKRYCDLSEEWIWTRDPKTRRPVQRKIFHYDGATNTDELQRLLREHVMVRRLKEDVLKSLPPKRHQCIEISCNGLQHFVDEENELENRFNDEIESLKREIQVASDSGNQKTFEEASARLEKAYRAHFGEMAKLAHVAALAKVPKVVAYCLELLDGNEKLAIFAHHHDVEMAIESALQEAGIKTVRLTGMESPKQKDQAISAFQEGDARAFIGGLKCGIGYTITAASRVVLAELDWTPGVMDQAIDRLHRIGQTDSVLATYIVLENSLDAKKVGMLISKRDVANKVLDKPLKDFTEPMGEPKPKEEKPELPPTHVLEILERLGIKDDQVTF